ncbi:MAG: hypothetical protein K2N07_04235, partial [Desulfovibrio sp.]|nr:hypothetical protein [Desulfovibrio sp.]
QIIGDEIHAVFGGQRAEKPAKQCVLHRFSLWRGPLGPLPPPADGGGKAACQCLCLIDCKERANA